MTHGKPENLFDQADLYEAIYRGRGKDYAQEARRVLDVVSEHLPEAVSLLDVACGPAAHLVHFADHFDRVEGVDLSEDMVRLAKRRAPRIPFHQADMRDFSVPGRFDVVTCMFSSIGYARNREELGATLRSITAHLSVGGIVVVEPWWFPEDFRPGHVGGSLTTVDGRTISRVSRSVREGDATRMDVHYTVASPEEGIRSFSDTHRMTLFAYEEYVDAFTEAGLAARYLSDPDGGPGFIIGTSTLR